MSSGIHVASNAYGDMLKILINIEKKLFKNYITDEDQGFVFSVNQDKLINIYHHARNKEPETQNTKILNHVTIILIILLTFEQVLRNVQ